MNVVDWLASLLGTGLKVVDPDLGVLRGTHIGYRNDDYVCWATERIFAISDEHASVSVFADERGPTAIQIALFAELKQRYPQLRHQIEDPLATEYERVRSSWKLTSPILRAPSEIWRIARLTRIEINRAGASDSDLILDYSIEWEADHDLNVTLKNWGIVEVMFEG